MRRWALLIAILVAFAVFSLQVVAAEPQMGQPQVVFVMDLSGSVLEADSEKYFIDALKLGVDLAPYGAELALITVNDKIVAETSLMGMDDELNRAAIKEAISQITCSGNTNFTAGLTRALELLQASPNTSQNKRIVDAKTGEALFLPPFSQDALLNVQVHSADGRQVALTNSPNTGEYIYPRAVWRLYGIRTVDCGGCCGASASRYH